MISNILGRGGRGQEIRVTHAIYKYIYMYYIYYFLKKGFGKFERGVILKFKILDKKEQWPLPALLSGRKLPLTALALMLDNSVPPRIFYCLLSCCPSQAEPRTTEAFGHF